MSGVPYTFASATSSIPLSQLDANFATPVTIGNTTVGLGNTVTTLGNVTLTNVTISSGLLSSATIPVANGTVMISGNMPAFSYWANSATAVPSLTQTKILFDTKEFDTNNNFSSSRFTPTVAGYYQINSVVGISSSYTNLLTSIYKNGSIYKSGTQTTSGALSGVSSIVYLNGSTDYVEIYCTMVTGQNSATGIQNTYFNGSLVRAA
jgi:hypothetical protein